MFYFVVTVKEVDDCPSQEFGTCHFASLAEVINLTQQSRRQTKSRQAVIHRCFFIWHGC
jgi:hypothetical protein